MPTSRQDLPPRVRLDLPVQVEGGFVSRADRIVRISFALFDDGQPDIRGTGPYATAVTVWPGDRDGIVAVERLERGDLHVVRWVISATEFATLRALHAVGWRFTECDLLVSGGASQPLLLPTARTLAHSAFAPRLDRARFEALVLGRISSLNRIRQDDDGTTGAAARESY